MAPGPSARNTDEPQQLNILAAILAWVWPGLGHISLGERRRGFLAMAGILLLFFGGLFVGGFDAVDRSEDRLWFVGQAGVGPLAFVVSYSNDALLKSGRVGELLPTPVMSRVGDPRSAGSAQVSSFKGLAHANEFGTLACFLAGLMNFIVVLDAVVRVTEEPTHDRRRDDTKAGSRA